MNVDELKNAFGKFLTGVTVVTTKTSDGVLLGFTANSFTSVSLDPPILLVCLGQQLSSFDEFQNADSFCVNILSEHQSDISTIFAVSKEDRFAQIKWEFDALGNPLIKDAAAHFSCQSHDKQIIGDHMILFGEVKDCSSSDQQGLGYTQRKYVTTKQLS